MKVELPRQRARSRVRRYLVQCRVVFIVHAAYARSAHSKYSGWQLPRHLGRHSLPVAEKAKRLRCASRSRAGPETFHRYTSRACGWTRPALPP